MSGRFQVWGTLPVSPKGLVRTCSRCVALPFWQRCPGPLVDLGALGLMLMPMIPCQQLTRLLAGVGGVSSCPRDPGCAPTMGMQVRGQEPVGGPPPSNAAHALSHGLAAPLHRTLPLTQLHSSAPLSPHVGGIKSRGPDAAWSCMCVVGTLRCDPPPAADQTAGRGVGRFPCVPQSGIPRSPCEDADVGTWVQVEGPHLVLPMRASARPVRVCVWAAPPQAALPL